MLTTETNKRNVQVWKYTCEIDLDRLTILVRWPRWAVKSYYRYASVEQINQVISNMQDKQKRREESKIKTMKNLKERVDKLEKIIISIVLIQWDFGKLRLKKILKELDIDLKIYLKIWKTL